jgi:hypothetical protein
MAKKKVIKPNQMLVHVTGGKIVKAPYGSEIYKNTKKTHDYAIITNKELKPTLEKALNSKGYNNFDISTGNQRLFIKSISNQPDCEIEILDSTLDLMGVYAPINNHEL